MTHSTRFPPGTRLAHRSTVTPGSAAVGIVAATGRHVVWLDQVDTLADGSLRRRRTAAPVCRTPVPLRGDEVRCPPELERFVDVALGLEREQR